MDSLSSRFRPLPLLGNPHVQTVLGAYLPGRVCPPPQRRHALLFADGDALLLHENQPLSWRPGRPVALLLHGLTGSHQSAHIRRLAALLLSQRVRVFRADLRGAGAGISLARQSYHAGRSEDIRAALNWLHSECPTSPLLLVGVSLGGNTALKLAGEAADDPVPGLSRVAAINPPIDLDACCRLIEQPANRVYEQRFLRRLVQEASERQMHFPDLPPIDPQQFTTLRGFDDQYTAPRNGFGDAATYYREASSFRYIPRIPVPTLILTARDDPFIAVEPFEALRVPEHVRVHIAPWGGHVGFVGWDGVGGIRWGERRVVEWLLRE
jgi:predicted alpha/beta-fold hydrolase